MDTIVSPCVRICVVDPATQACLGCERTLSEIGHWPTMTHAARKAVMAQLPARRAARGPVAAKANV